MSEPQLTVILPVRNGAKFIGAAIASVLNQSYKNFNLWILENGSDDRTLDVARSFRDSRIRVFELGPVGVQGALHYGIEHAPTEWLARMDADDLMFPNRLQLQVKFIKAHPDVVFVGTAWGFLTPFGHVLELPPLGSREITKQELAGRRGFPDSSIIFNRYAAINAGGVDTEFKKCDGLPLMFRLLTQGKAWGMDEHLQLYRLRPHSLSKEAEHAEESRKIHLKYAPEFCSDTAPGSAKNFWRFVADLELLSGNVDSARRAIECMKRDVDYNSGDKDFANLPGPFSRIYYRWLYRNRYRHRPDWEKLFSGILSSDNALTYA